MTKNNIDTKESSALYPEDPLFWYLPGLTHFKLGDFDGIMLYAKDVFCKFWGFKNTKIRTADEWNEIVVCKEACELIDLCERCRYYGKDPLTCELLVQYKITETLLASANHKKTDIMSLLLIKTLVRVLLLKETQNFLFLAGNLCNLAAHNEILECIEQVPPGNENQMIVSL